MTVDNPFYHRGAIRRADHFHGREAEITQILGLLRNGQSVSLIGPRRIGKSSLLIHLTRPQVRHTVNLQPPQVLFVLLDCQELGGSPPEDVYDALLTGLQDAADDVDIQLVMNQQSGTYRALDRMLRQLQQQDVSVVVVLDEFELLAANEHLTPYFFARLRGLTTKYGLAYLTASQRPLFAITAEEEILSSPFFNIFVTLSLDMFTPEEGKGLLQKRLQPTAVRFSGALVDYLLFLVGPHPFFLHIAGYHAFQAISGGNPLQNEADWVQLDAPIEIETFSHLGYLWQNLSAEEQYALAIADGPIDNLRQLEQQCLLAQVDDQYQYTNDMLRRFVRRQKVAGLIQAGPFVIDQQRHQVWGRGEGLSLTTSQFAILVKLCEQAGQVVRAEDLETAVWGEVLVDDPDRLKTLIKRLRRAVEPFGTWIISERGVGYTLRPPG